MMDFNEIYMLFAVIEKASAHPGKFPNIISAALTELAAIESGDQPQATGGEDGEGHSE